MLEGYMFSENSFNFDILSSDNAKFSCKSVFILGKQYNTESENASIKNDVRCMLWFTYRKGFDAIGDSGLTSDKGWGCMLRCGQMVLAQALIDTHLGKTWKWNEHTKDDKYLKILDMFYDDELSQYSIHKIAQVGLMEGKEVGEWFGPNTIVQVLKKLSSLDYWGNVAIHVAMDNLVVISDIKELCTNYQAPSSSSLDTNIKYWRPLLLAVPLRIGLSEVNPVYIDNLKECLKVPQSAGIIGGRPNHAYYFIGYCGNDVLFLDPHYTQPVARVQKKELPEEAEADLTYHYSELLTMPITEMDPSVAVCFVCKTEMEFDELCQKFKSFKNTASSSTMFEVCDTPPVLWEPPSGLSAATYSPTSSHLFVLDPCCPSDSESEEFEIIG